MKQVDYKGFSWTKVPLDDDYLCDGRSYGAAVHRTLRPEYLRWIISRPSGGYFYITPYIEKYTNNLTGETKIVSHAAVYFSRQGDAMLFRLQCL